MLFVTEFLSMVTGAAQVPGSSYFTDTSSSVGQSEMVKARFHYASWFEAGLQLVRSWFKAGSKLQRAEIWPII